MSVSKIPAPYWRLKVTKILSELYTEKNFLLSVNVIAEVIDL